METVEVTSLSAEGQVLIPPRLRRQLGLAAGDKFVVVANGDAVILKRLHNPRLESFEELSRAARRRARELGLTKKDLERAIQKVRGR